MNLRYLVDAPRIPFRLFICEYQISNLGLFGSVARHEQRVDIDIYYESSHMSLFTLCCLKSELEKLLGCSVDLFRKRESFRANSWAICAATNLV